MRNVAESGGARGKQGCKGCGRGQESTGDSYKATKKKENEPLSFRSDLLFQRAPLRRLCIALGIAAIVVERAEAQLTEERKERGVSAG